MTHLLTATNLTIEVNEQAILAGFNLIVERGDLVELVGGNGSGKTTLLRHLAGVRRPAIGEISRTESFVYVGQKLGLDPLMTVGENLAWFATISNRAWDKDSLDRALVTCGLERIVDAQIGTLSTGQAKRAALSRLLLARSNLWLLDEPLAGLDASGIALVKRLMRQHISDGGGALVATHSTLELEGCETVTLDAV